MGSELDAMRCYDVAQLVGGGLFDIAGPMATLMFNFAGSSLMFVIVAALAAGILFSEAWRGFIGVGFLNALTTFSSFFLDTGQLAARKGMPMTALYVGLSVGLLLGGFFAMLAVVTAFIGRMPE